jgi:arabinogalactan oligomer/maltooligosaccharide transport system substrate-binding protein
MLRPLLVRSYDSLVDCLAMRFLYILAFVFGCSVTEPVSSTSIQLVVWHAYEKGGAEQRFLTESLERYRATRPGVGVEAVAVPFEPFANKINVAVPRGNGPDVFIFAHDVAGDWASKNIVEPLGPWVEPAWLDAIEPRALDAFMYRNEIYGIPLTAKTLGLFYKHGVVSEPARDTSELERQLRAFRQRQPHGVGLAYDVDDLFFHAPWLFGFGGALLRGDKVVFDKVPYVNGLIRSMEMVKRWVDDGLVPADTNYDSIKDKFRRGEVAYVMSGPWFATDLAPGSFGVATLPKISNAQDAPARPFMTVEGLYISRYSQRKHQALDLVRFLTSQVESIARKKKTGGVVTRLDSGAALTPLMATFEAQMSLAVPTPNSPAMKALWTPLNRVLSEVVKRHKPPGKAIEEARLLLDRAGGIP